MAKRIGELPPRTFADASRAVVTELKRTIPLRLWSVSELTEGRLVHVAVDDDLGAETAGTSHAWSASFSRTMVAGTTPSFAPDAMAVPEYAGAGVAQDISIGAWVGLPLRAADGRLFGVLGGLDPEVQGPDLLDHRPQLELLSSLLEQILRADQLRTDATDRETALVARSGHDAALLRAVLDMITDGVAVMDSAGRNLLFNRAARTLIGASPESSTHEDVIMQGRFFRADGITPLPPEEFPRTRALTTGAFQQAELVVRCPGQSRSSTLVVGVQPLEPAAGIDGGGWVATYRDVTVARTLAADLGTQRDQFARLLGAVSDIGKGVIIAEADRFVSVNDAYTELTGYSRDELLTMHPDAVAHGTNGVEQFEAWRRRVAARPGTPARMSMTLRHRDGHAVPVETIGIGAQHGGVWQRVSVVRDLTEQERTQAELADRAEALATANRELAVARDAAREASRAKSVFLATMSHEIRNPMHSVIGVSELLLDTDLNTEQRAHVEMLNSNGDALLAIINDILDLSKIESGSLTLEQRPFGLRGCIESGVATVAGLVGAKDVDLLVRIDPQLPETVIGDVTRLRQIVVNLVGNALKFTPGGHVLADVGLLPGPVETGHGRAAGGTVTIRLAVSDSGIGIAADRLDRLFKDFSQVDDSITRNYGGTGLGLAISRRLAQAMQGSISARSTLGVGSTFTADVCLRSVGRAPQPAAAAQLAPGALRALVVDDNDIGRAILVSQLAEIGLEVDQACSGPAALHLLLSGARYDLGLIDYRMPGMDGLTLAARAGAPPLSSAMPVVMLTSMTDRAVVEADSPQTRQLTRPIRSTDLRDTVAGMLAGRADLPAPRADLDLVPAEDAPGPTVEPSSVRVLLVEDSPDVREVTLKMLRSIGYTADAVSGGAAALRAVDSSSYGVVLMDMNMPEMDGLETTRRLRRDPPTGPRAWVIALTGNVMLGDRDHCSDAGMDDFLGKPFRRKDLVDALSRVPSTR